MEETRQRRRFRRAWKRGAPWSLGRRNVRPANAGVVAGHRFYSPGIGRWVNRDPIGERGGRNLYRFARNAPISLVDLYGLCPGNMMPLGVPTPPTYPWPLPGFGNPGLPPGYPPSPPPSGGGLSWPVELSDDDITGAVQARIQPCIASHLENLLTHANGLAKEACADDGGTSTGTATESYTCLAFMYTTVAYILGSTLVTCNSKVECTWDCCEGESKWCKDKTHCSFWDPIDVNLGIITVPLGIAYIGEWNQ